MTTYYVDYNRGSDSNAGTSMSAPWKHWTKIDDAAKSAGDVILFANDSVWEYDLSTRVTPPTSWVGTQTKPVVIGKYSPLSAGTGNPTVRWNTKIAAGDWTYSAPNNCWQYTSPLDPGAQCLVRLGNTWAASRIDGTQLPLASVDGRYSASGTTFSLYAPAGTNPTDYYGEVLLSSQKGFLALSSERNCIDVEDIDFEYTCAGIVAYSGTAADVRFNLRRIGGRFVSVPIYANSDSPGQLFLSIKDCNFTEWGSAAIHVLTNGGAGMKQVEISGNTITNGLHCFAQGAIYIQTRGTGLVTRVHDNHISGVRWGSRDKIYDGCGIYVETGADVVEVYRNTIYDAGCAMQDNSGRGSKWFSNLVYDCKTAMRVSDQSDRNAMAHEFYNNTCIVGVDKSAYSEFGVQPSEAGWRCYRPTGTITSLLVKNNVFVNQGAVQAAAILTPEVTPITSSYINNAASGGYTNIAAREHTPFTVETSTGSVTADPFLTDDYRPKSGSPLLQAGVHLGYTRDINGKQRPNPPSIGAYDVATMKQN